MSAFWTFCPTPTGGPRKPLLESGNLVILKAFTKLYGMAGVRLGYCLCGDETLLEKMQTAGPAVGRVQSGAGGRCRGPERNRLCGRGTRPYRPAAARSDGGPAGAGPAGHRWKGELSALPRARRPERRLRPLGTQVRSCSNYPGLGPEWYRTAVRTAPENARLLELMKEVLG